MRELTGNVVRGWPDMMVARDKTALLKAVARALRRRELAAVGPLRPANGVWYVQVIRLKTTRPKRVLWPWVAGGTVATLAAAAAAGWWLASAVHILIPGSILLTVALAVGRWLAPSPGCTITHTRH